MNLFLVVKILTLLILSVESSGPVLEEVLLGSLASFPSKTCTAKESIGPHMTCCMITCDVIPMTPIRPPLPHDVFVECFPLNQAIDCSNTTIAVRRDNMERELDTKKKNAVSLEAKKEIKKVTARFKVMLTLIKILKWFTRLSLSWFFHKLFTKLFSMFLKFAV